MADLSHPANLAFAIRESVTQVVREQMPDLAALFPFQSGFNYDELRAGSQIVLRISDQSSLGVPSVGTFTDNEPLRAVAEAALAGPSLTALQEPNWRSAQTFSYLGPAPTGEAKNWPELWNEIVTWINEDVIPNVLSLNRARILRAIAEPPAFDARLIESCVVVDDGAVQGSAFLLEGVGFVTCLHVLMPASTIHTREAPNGAAPISLVSSSAAIDLAVFTAPLEVEPLKRAESEVNLYGHLAALGYPNYQLGDSGVLMPGIVVGYRMRSGVRRLLTNSRIVGGMSGGPVVDAHGNVVGVSVTGADRLEATESTEDHGAIPIDALQLL